MSWLRAARVSSQSGSRTDDCLPSTLLVRRIVKVGMSDAAVSLSSPLPPQMPLTLLVDRDIDTRRMYAQYLKSRPSEVDEAEDGREALAKAIARRPDIIVTETRLAGIDGFTLCELLRSDRSTQDIPIVFVTGDAFDSEVQHAQRAGADAVLIKPCLPETLFTEMSRLLRLSAALRERARVTRAKIAVQLRRSVELVAESKQHRRRLTLSRAHVRQQTTTPSMPPPLVVCPACDCPLSYSHSNVGGVNAKAAEQWDYYDCSRGCGSFQYRQRTRKLRSVS